MTLACTEITQEIENLVELFKSFVLNSENIDKRVFEQEDRSKLGYYFRSSKLAAKKRMEARSIIINFQRERKNEYERLNKLEENSQPTVHAEIDLLVNKHVVIRLLDYVKNGMTRDGEINFLSWFNPLEWRFFTKGKFYTTCEKAEEKLNTLLQKIDQQLEDTHKKRNKP